MTKEFVFQWSENAIIELEQVYDYLLTNFGEVSAINLAFAIQKTLDNIQENPKLYQVVQAKNQSNQVLRKAIILRYNTLYFSVDEDNQIINILVFFSNRQNPNKLNYFIK